MREIDEGVSVRKREREREECLRECEGGNEGGVRDEGVDAREGDREKGPGHER